MRLADLTPTRCDQVFFGGVHGAPHWELVVQNFSDLLRGARGSILAATAIGGDIFDEIIDSLGIWSQRADSTLWYPICWAEAVRAPDQSVTA